MALLGINDCDQFSLSHRSWVEEALRDKERIRERRWSDIIAVGKLEFVEQVKIGLGAKGLGRKIISSVDCCELRESQVSYGGHLGGEKRPLRYENSLPWCIYGVNTI
jgi:hypothetical protein